MYNLHLDFRTNTILTDLSVKAVDILAISLPASTPSGRLTTTIVTTVSSDGNVHVYDMAALPLDSTSKEVLEIKPAASYSTKGTRLTCVTLADGEVLTSAADLAKKRKHDEEVESDDSENDDEWAVEDQDQDQEEEEEEEEREED